MLKCFQTKFNKGHIRKTVVLLALGISLTFSAFSQTGLSMAQGRPSPVAVDEVEVIEMSQTMPVLGRLVAQQRTTLAALVEGPVLDVTVQVGDLVAAGDVLIKLDDSILTQNLRFAEAKLKQSRANLLTAENAHALSVQEIARLQKLSGSAAFSPARLEDKQLEESRLKAMIEVARATVTASEAEVQLARINLKRTNIKAPFNGIVVAKHTEAGSYLSKGSQVLAILNHEELEVEADVPSNRLSGLEVGRVVELKMGDSGSGSQVDSIVRAIIPEENILTRTRAVRFTIVQGMGADSDAGRKMRLASGQSVTVMIPVGEARQVVAVPKDAVIARGDGHEVFVVRDDKVSLRKITIGNGVADRFEVLGGLQAGDVVVVRGNERLRDGQQVVAETAAQ